MRKRVGGYGQDLKALEGERGTKTDTNQKKERQQIQKRCSVCGNQFWVAAHDIPYRNLELQQSSTQKG
jgi:hypothetical protein